MKTPVELEKMGKLEKNRKKKEKYRLIVSPLKLRSMNDTIAVVHFKYVHKFPH